jgi:hypothetical protein
VAFHEEEKRVKISPGGTSNPGKETGMVLEGSEPDLVQACRRGEFPNCCARK